MHNELGGAKKLIANRRMRERQPVDDFLLYKDTNLNSEISQTDIRVL